MKGESPYEAFSKGLIKGTYQRPFQGTYDKGPYKAHYFSLKNTLLSLEIDRGSLYGSCL